MQLPFQFNCDRFNSFRLTVYILNWSELSTFELAVRNWTSHAQAAIPGICRILIAGAQDA